MEGEGSNKSEKPKTKLPPERGQIKARIFKGLVKKVVAVTRIGRNEGGNRSSASISPPASSYNSDAHSEY